MDLRQPNVVLRGGSAWQLPEHERTIYVEDATAVLKLPLGNRHEHFAPTRETMSMDGQVLLVFDWVETTYVAE